MLGSYEMGRVELLRDLFIWAYERSTQEYSALHQMSGQTLAEPDALRLTHHTLIKDTDALWCSRSRCVNLAGCCLAYAELERVAPSARRCAGPLCPAPQPAQGVADGAGLP